MLHAFDKLELIPRTKRQRNIPSSYLLILIEFCERSQRLNPCTARYSVMDIPDACTSINCTCFAMFIRASATEMVAIAP